MPDFQPIRVYLDSNVLFSASHNDKNRFLEFWRLSGITPVTSPYVVGEVSRNIRTVDQRARFERLLEKTPFVSDGLVEMIPPDVILVKKDQQVLASAICASVDYLVTGDGNHFGHLYGKTVAHVVIMRPIPLLDLHQDRLIL